MSASDLTALFQAVEFDVYDGRERMGRFLRTGPRRFAAYDAADKSLGVFRKPKDACAAISEARAKARSNG